MEFPDNRYCSNKSPPIVHQAGFTQEEIDQVIEFINEKRRLFAWGLLPNLTSTFNQTNGDVVEIVIIF